jgi:hypothetical protein
LGEEERKTENRERGGLVALGTQQAPTGHYQQVGGEGRRRRRGIFYLGLLLSLWLESDRVDRKRFSCEQAVLTRGYSRARAQYRSQRNGTIHCSNSNPPVTRGYS